MKHFNAIDWAAFVLSVFGGINWGLVGLNASWNVIHLSFGSIPEAERIAYVLIGLSALWTIYAAARVLTSNENVATDT